MTFRNGRRIVAGAAVLLTGYLLEAAWSSGEWRGFALTEGQLLLAMTASWWVLRSAPE